MDPATVVRIIGAGLGLGALVWCIALAIRAYRNRDDYPG